MGKQKIKGITLIALVITIIVLIILAGVSIATLTGPNGLLTQARNAADLTEQAQKEEENMLDELSVMMQGENATKVTDKTPGILDGEGTEEKPYLIESIEDLASFSEEVNEGKDYNGKVVKLEVNLDFNEGISYVEAGELKEKLTEGKGFTPIGTESNKFNGIFDGKGHTLRNLYISVEGDNNIGLFGYTDTSSNIKNIILSNVNITSQGKNIGGVVGQNNGTIEKVTIESGNVIGNTDVGGIAGWNTGKIIECTNGGKIKGIREIGGIVGNSENSQINLCTNNGEIVGDGLFDTNDKQYHVLAGGIVGRGSNSSIKDCKNDGKIWGSQGLAIGGICGVLVNNSSIEKCYNNGEIGNIKKESNENNVGGICGELSTNSSISRSYNIGEIYGGESVGGIVGILGWNSSATIDNCYNIGKISAIRGGVAGITFVSGNVIDCEISNSYDIGEIIVTEYENKRNIGGAVATNNLENTTITNCYYLKGIEKENTTAIVLQDAELSNGKTEDEMKQEGFIKELNGENKEEVWQKDETGDNKGYPILK